MLSCSYLLFNDTAATEISTLSLHDALPISRRQPAAVRASRRAAHGSRARTVPGAAVDHSQRRGGDEACRSPAGDAQGAASRSEEHTSELQSRQYLACRLLLEQNR